MRGFKRALFMTCAIAALAVGAAACNDDGDDAESNSTASQESIDALSATVTENEQFSSLLAFGTLGLHAMDEDLNETSVIESNYAPNTTKLIRILALTDWGQFQDDAEDLRAHAEALLTALHDEDIETAKTEATAVHDGEHDFNKLVMNELVKDLDPELGGPDLEEHGGGSATPGADETPGEEHEEMPGGTDGTPESEGTP
jgi:hypothetical protein